MTVDYTIIIPAYNEEELLPATLASLSRAMAAIGPWRGEIVVTDNDSSDRTAEVARDAGARVVFEEHRQIARSRNVGGRSAEGRFLVFVDADTQVSAALLERTLAMLETGSACGGGTAARFESSAPRSVRRLEVLWNWLSRRFKWACGAYVFCQREAFDDTGGFDERYYASEEIHFSRALRRWGRQRGMQFVILDEPIVTSVRKVEWFRPHELLRMALRAALRPASLRTRESCELWYVRPQQKREATVDLWE